MLAALFGVAMGLPAIPFYTIGIFAPILAAEFGWSFASIFAGLSLLAAGVLLAGPAVGFLVDRLGARRVASISLPCLGLSYMALAASNGSLGRYYVTWAAIALCGLGATPVVFTRAISSAFEARRGLALGIALSGTGLFTVMVKPLAQVLISAAGWRAAIVVIGALPLLIAAPVVAWGLAGEDRQPARKPVENAIPQEMSARDAFRSRAFWLLAIVFVPMSLAVAALLPNIENILRSLRLPPAQVVQLAALVGIATSTGRLLGGVLVDRFWAPAVGTVILTMGAVACLIFSLGVTGFLPALAAILLLGLTSGIEFDLMAYLVARYLGLRSYGATYAVLYGVFVIGAFVGPSLHGYAYDRTGSYSGIMAASAILLVAGALVILLLGPYPERPSRALHEAVER